MSITTLFDSLLETQLRLIVLTINLLMEIECY